MIGKIIKGRNFKQCLDYVMGKKGAVIIDTNIIGNNVAEYAHELDYFARKRPDIEKKVCHMMLSLPVYEKLEDTSWVELLDQYLTKMGFSKSHYIAVKHCDRSHEHIHIVANRVTLDGSVVPQGWDAIRSQKIIRELETDYGLTPVKSSWESDRSSKTIGQLNYEAKAGTPLIKTQIADKVDAALAKSTNMPELITELNANQVGVKISKNRSGELMGISFNLDNVSVAGSRIGRIYSLSQVLKRLENSVAAENIPQIIAQPQDKNVLALEQNAKVAIAEIPRIIRESLKPNITMPELVDRLKESGIDAHVKYTRTKKVKGISFSVSNESIAGNELGKEFSFNGLQKYLHVSFDEERDNPKLSKRSLDKIELPQVAVTEVESEEIKQQQADITTSVESAADNPSLKNQPRQIKLDESPAVSAEEVYKIVEIGRNLLEATGKSEHLGNHYHFKSEGNTLAIALSESREVILQVTDRAIEINNLTRLDVERFNIAAQQKGDEKQREREKEVEREKMPEIER